MIRDLLKELRDIEKGEKMKKVITIILIVLAGFILISVFSLAPSDKETSDDNDGFFDGIKDGLEGIFGKDEDETTDSTVTTSPDESNKVYDHVDGMFYWFEDGVRCSSGTLSGIPDGTQGYFQSDGNVYYCVKLTGTGEYAVTLNPLTYGDYTYLYVLISVMDMTDTSNYVNYTTSGSATFTGERLICYTMEELPCDIITINDDLCENQKVTFYYDYSKVLNEGVFYYVNSSGATTSTVTPTSLSEATRGYFIVGNRTYFGVVHTGSDAFFTYLYDGSNEFPTYSSYTYCMGIASHDLKTVNMVDGNLSYSGTELIVYAYLDNCIDPAAANVDLINNVEMSIGNCDPESSEGPSGS